MWIYSTSKKILTAEEAVAHLETHFQSDLSDIDICQLSLEETAHIKDKGDLMGNRIETIILYRVSEMIDVIKKKY